jgi:hypothetical protein
MSENVSAIRNEMEDKCLRGILIDAKLKRQSIRQHNLSIDSRVILMFLKRQSEIAFIVSPSSFAAGIDEGMSRLCIEFTWQVGRGRRPRFSFEFPSNTRLRGVLQESNDCKLKIKKF